MNARECTRKKQEPENQMLKTSIQIDTLLTYITDPFSTRETENFRPPFCFMQCSWGYPIHPSIHPSAQKEYQNQNQQTL